MKKIILLLWILSNHIVGFCQADNPFIKLVNPLKEKTIVNSSKQFIIGSTCKSCSVDINNISAKVYSTGAIAFPVSLSPGDSTFEITATNPAGKKIKKAFRLEYTPPKAAVHVTTFGIESIKTTPEGNLVLLPGDKIQFKVKAFPGADITTLNGTVLHELPAVEENGMMGIYRGEYVIKNTDNFSALKFPVTISAADGRTAVKETANSFSVMSSLTSDIGITKGRLAHLEYGLGNDRLGGAKIGYLDSLIPLKIIGKVGADYKIFLAPNRTAYIPDDLVTLMPKGSIAGASLTNRWEVYGDSSYDYIKIGLNSKLPYQSFQQVDPSVIIVDLFGATNNTNWISQLQTAKEVKNIDHEQVQDGVFRVRISLNHRQHWGHSIYYNENTLVIKIKQHPPVLSLKHLTIAVDAGHGGTNIGAGGATGVAEKDLALALSLKLRAALETAGAKVLMTRTTEKFVDNKERILNYRDNTPDLLVSIHLNSSNDPLGAAGTASLYKHIGFKPLSTFIHRRMLQLGLKEYGNVGAFNFMLNSPTEYPNALVETLFLSNPEEEALILDPAFQQMIADKIVAGIGDFLEEAGKGGKQIDL